MTDNELFEILKIKYKQTSSTNQQINDKILIYKNKPTSKALNNVTDELSYIIIQEVITSKQPVEDHLEMFNECFVNFKSIIDSYRVEAGTYPHIYFRNAFKNIIIQTNLKDSTIKLPNYLQASHYKYKKLKQAGASEEQIDFEFSKMVCPYRRDWRADVALYEKYSSGHFLKEMMTSTENKDDIFDNTLYFLDQLKDKQILTRDETRAMRMKLAGYTWKDIGEYYTPKENNNNKKALGERLTRAAVNKIKNFVQGEKIDFLDFQKINDKYISDETTKTTTGQ